MTGNAARTNAKLEGLSTASGGFAMLALDQRESLREMFPANAHGGLVGDQELVDFKRTAGAILSPLATGILLDRPFAVIRAERPDFIADGCALILAADLLHSVRGEGVVNTELDPEIDADFIRDSGASAIKLLVMWRRGQDPARAELVDRFLELARAAEVASFVEGIVRPSAGEEWVDAQDRHAAILEAAADIGADADVYKAEVPGYIPGDVRGVRAAAEALTAIVGHPWVVLSNGVQQADFSACVRESCAGGASGFLAGRAIWADTVASPDYAAAITARSRDRLRELSAIVESSRTGD